MTENKIIKNIGELKGKVLVFGGVYSNFHALKALKRISDELGIPSSNIICTGDIVGYCAQPQESIEAIKQWGIHCITGNVEIQLRNDEPDCGCNFNNGSKCDVLSNSWYPYAKKNISPAAINWLKTLPNLIEFEYNCQKGMVLHGSYNDTSEFIFQSTKWSKKLEIFNRIEKQIILGGHSGIPFGQTKENHTWINAGVIGMPANNGSNKVWFVILNDENDTMTYEFNDFSYDYRAAAQLMRLKKLPKEYARTLETGLWDNCEILPEEETNNQGKPLKLNI